MNRVCEGNQPRAPQSFFRGLFVLECTLGIKPNLNINNKPASILTTIFPATDHLHDVLVMHSFTDVPKPQLCSIIMIHRDRSSLIRKVEKENKEFDHFYVS